MNDILTADVRAHIEPVPMEGTENWSEDFALKDKHGRGLFDFVKAGFVLFAITASSVPQADPWVVLSGRDSSTVSINEVQGLRQKITLKEARKLALTILERAEKKRLAFAEQEARIGTILEDEQ